MASDFRLTDEHLALLRELTITAIPVKGWPFPPQIDEKRPFGNGDTYADVCRILRWSGDPDVDDDIRGRVEAVVGGLTAALQIVCLHAGLPIPVQTGVYRMARESDARSWQLVEV